MGRVNTGISENLKRNFLAVFVACVPFFGLQAGEPHPEKVQHMDSVTVHDHDDKSHAEEEFNSSTMGNTIMHHISDAHEWHLFTWGHTHATLSLPVILYSSEYGLDIFSSSRFHNENQVYKTYMLEHEHVYLLDASGNKILDAEGHPKHAMDFSITKNVASMMLSFAILCFIFISVAQAYKKRPGLAPKGFQGFMEPLILFVRDDIARPNLGEKRARSLAPYLLTLFFFIWINNLLGLLPGAANVTGNIAVTVCLALLTLIITNINGSKSYWGHIFWPPGVPFFVKLILIPVEIVGIVSKPFALLIRLFANITAGHIIILSILSLIFLFGESGKNPGAGFGVSAAAIPFAIFLYCLELLVAALQAYIFTMLTALFIGQAAEDHSTHHEEHH